MKNAGTVLCRDAISRQEYRARENKLMLIYRVFVRFLFTFKSYNFLGELTIASILPQSLKLLDSRHAVAQATTGYFLYDTSADDEYMKLIT